MARYREQNWKPTFFDVGYFAQAECKANCARRKIIRHRGALIPLRPKVSYPRTKGPALLTKSSVDSHPDLPLQSETQEESALLTPEGASKSATRLESWTEVYTEERDDPPFLMYVRYRQPPQGRVQQQPLLYQGRQTRNLHPAWCTCTTGKSSNNPIIRVGIICHIWYDYGHIAQSGMLSIREPNFLLTGYETLAEAQNPMVPSDSHEHVKSQYRQKPKEGVTPTKNIYCAVGRAERRRSLYKSGTK